MLVIRGLRMEEKRPAIRFFLKGRNWRTSENNRDPRSKWWIHEWDFRMRVIYKRLPTCRLRPNAGAITLQASLTTPVHLGSSYATCPDFPHVFWQLENSNKPQPRPENRESFASSNTEWESRCVGALICEFISHSTNILEHHASADILFRERISMDRPLKHAAHIVPV
jgi:hypothetical protein